MEKIMKLMKNLGSEEAALQPFLSEAPKLQAVMNVLFAKPATLRAPIDAGNIR